MGMSSFLGKSESGDLQRKIESLTISLLDSYEELDLIYRATERIMATTDISLQLQLIVDEATQIFQADWSWITLENFDDRPSLIPGKVPGPSILRAIHATVVQQVLKRGRSCTHEDLRREIPDHSAEMPLGMHIQVLKSEQEVFGSLCVGWQTAEHFFSSGEVKLANVLGTVASLALQNDSLHRKRREEEKALLRIQEEMRLASRIQRDLLPQSPPKIPGYDIAGRTQPARIVGGDYFDFIPMVKDRLAIAIGDVSGKGLPASLLMANLQATIRGQTLLSVSPGVALLMANRLLYASTNDAKFITLVYGALDVVSHQFIYSNGGHDPPLLFPLTGPPQELAVGGLLLGIIENAAYKEEVIPLQPGELLLLYSDGITEGRNDNDQEFGVEALIDLVRQNRHLSADVLLDKIFTTARDHCGSDTQQDDQTIILIKRTAGSPY